MRHLQIALAALLLASACATEPVSSSTAPQSTDVLDAAVVTPRAGAGQIVVTRDTGALGSACTFDLLVDGGRVGGLKAGEQLALYVDPGEHIVGVVGRESMCGGGVAQVEVTIAADQRKGLGVGMSQGWDILIEPSAPWWRRGHGLRTYPPRSPPGARRAEHDH